MKNRTQRVITIAMLLLILLIGCKKSYNTPGTNNNNVPSVTNGTWTITSYTQRTENKTGDFSGINFTFSSDGKVVASGAYSASGSWSSTPASTDYYGNSTVASFTINLGSSSPFNKLSKSWNIGEQATTVLRLDNKETTEDEHITFSKN